MNLIENGVYLQNEIIRLEKLLYLLQNVKSIDQKIEILNHTPQVKNFLASNSSLLIFSDQNKEKEFLIKSIFAIDQAPLVFNRFETQKNKSELLNKLLSELQIVETFYHYLGGIIGYQCNVLKLVQSSSQPHSMHSETVCYIEPVGLDINKESPEVLETIRVGLENLDTVAEVYPVGGAGDRLNLIDSETGAHLPAALLEFNGFSLLHGLIRDLQAREYLYFKLYGKQLMTPIAMMTSHEKNNHFYILSICKSNHWFGRHEHSFSFFTQPLVPVITKEGNWSLTAPLELSLKPGGHGVIWKLAEDHGIFDQFISGGFHHVLVRQINNPLAGTDFALFSLLGQGIKKNKSFGFISCERVINSAEGTNVLIEKKTKSGFDYCLTNIEYTDFVQKGITELPEKSGSPYSRFPTNTNILFASINSIRDAIKKCPVPGLLINMKNKVSYIDEEGSQTFVEGGRLESTMQNIADYFVDSAPTQLKKDQIEDYLRTFIIYNKRAKTISTTKATFKKDQSPVGTPEQAYYDKLSNNVDLFTRNCEFTLPVLLSFEAYLENGPNFIINYHPALGPLYTIIGQKIRKGSLIHGSELQLEIAEADIFELTLKGSLIIESASPLGYQDESNILRYGQESRCHLHHVTVSNKGIDYSENNCFWKNQIKRAESLHIILGESAEFFAENVEFNGNFFFEVPAGHRLVVKDENGTMIQKLQKIEKASWQWLYEYDADNKIMLIKTSK